VAPVIGAFSAALALMAAVLLFRNERLRTV
jgi:hypothetical protein